MAAALVPHTARIGSSQPKISSGREKLPPESSGKPCVAVCVPCRSYWPRATIIGTSSGCEGGMRYRG
jgi:hypothetical protein